MNETNRVYIHTAPVRVWHWINAAGFLVLIITGLQIRYADMVHILPLGDAITIHNYTGFLVIINYFVWLVYYFSNARITIYIPSPRNLISMAVKQIRFYGYGIFRGDSNPHSMSPQNKFNVLQQLSYLVIMLFLIPAQMASGLFLWKIKGYSDYITILGGVKVIATIHVALFFIFTAFLVVHVYLATLGHTPLAHVKAMITGYEEEHHHETA